jgi:hypothetical protein
MCFSKGLTLASALALGLCGIVGIPLDRNAQALRGFVYNLKTGVSTILDPLAGDQLAFRVRPPSTDKL